MTVVSEIMRDFEENRICLGCGQLICECRLYTRHCKHGYSLDNMCDKCIKEYDRIDRLITEVRKDTTPVKGEKEKK